MKTRIIAAVVAACFTVATAQAQGIPPTGYYANGQPYWARPRPAPSPPNPSADAWHTAVTVGILGLLAAAVLGGFDSSPETPAPRGGGADTSVADAQRRAEEQLRRQRATEQEVESYIGGPQVNDHSGARDMPPIPGHVDTR